jgi:hypothetical protein
MSELPQFGAPPTDLDFEKSLMFFHAYMYGPLQGKLRLYGEVGHLFFDDFDNLHRTERS